MVFENTKGIWEPRRQCHRAPKFTEVDSAQVQMDLSEEGQKSIMLHICGDCESPYFPNVLTHNFPVL